MRKIISTLIVKIKTLSKYVDRVFIHIILNILFQQGHLFHTYKLIAFKSI
jgi:hypothetical protein